MIVSLLLYHCVKHERNEWEKSATDTREVKGDLILRTNGKVVHGLKALVGELQQEA
jgi:hypothetical protein